MAKRSFLLYFVSYYLNEFCQLLHCYKQFRNAKRYIVGNFLHIFPYVSNLYISFIFKICRLKNKGLVCDLMLLEIIALKIYFCNLFIGINVEAKALPQLLRQHCNLNLKSE